VFPRICAGTLEEKITTHDFNRIATDAHVNYTVILERSAYVDLAGTGFQFLSSIMTRARRDGTREVRPSMLPWSPPLNRSADPHVNAAVAFRLTGKNDGSGFRQVHLAGDGVHLRVGQSVGIEKDSK
jgi:hypothetical protein